MKFINRVQKKYKIAIAGILGLAIVFIGFSSFNIVKDGPKKVKIIVIDPGHGGKDPGCNGVNHREKDVALAVALRLGKLIEENMKDVKVIFTRKTDVFVELEDRAKVANDNNADLFISIHCNAAGKPVMIKDKKTGKMRPKTFKNSKGKTIVVETTNPVPYGAETYVMGLKNEEGKMKVAQRENSAILLEDNYETKYQGFDPNSEESYIIMSNYTSSYVIQSASLALKIQEQYSKKAGRLDKGVHRQSIWVLWRTSMPSVLTELGYLTNPDEEKFLGSEKGQDYLAACIFRALRRYKDEQEGTKKNYEDALENQKPLEKEVYTTKDESKDEEVAENEDSTGKTEEVKKDNVIADKEKLEKEKLEKEKSEKEALAAKAKELELQKQIVDLKKSADADFKMKNYTGAKDSYEKVVALTKGEDTYSKTKITEIEQLLKKQADELAAQKEKEEENKVVTKNDIIKNYKDKTKKDSTEKSLNTSTSPVKSDIVFKVQFAATDKEVDSKTKFPNVQDVWFYKAGVVYKYTSGSFSSFDEATKHQAKLKELGYKDCFVAAFKNGNRMDITEAKKAIGAE